MRGLELKSMRKMSKRKRASIKEKKTRMPTVSIEVFSIFNLNFLYFILISKLKKRA
jgi:hypothetical protein